MGSDVIISIKSYPAGLLIQKNSKRLISSELSLPHCQYLQHTASRIVVELENILKWISHDLPEATELKVPQYVRCFSRDLNPSPPEHESSASPLH
jgi:hypothetical protein